MVKPQAAADKLGCHYRSVLRLARLHGIGTFTGFYDFSEDDVEKLRSLLKPYGKRTENSTRRVRGKPAVCENCGGPFLSDKGAKLCSLQCVGAVLQERNERKTCPTPAQIAAEMERIRNGEVVLTSCGGSHMVGMSKTCADCGSKFTSPECVKCAAREYQRSKGFKV